MFTTDNTTGYTDTQVDALNAELAQRLRGVEPGTDQFYEIEHAFSDEVAKR